MSYEMNKLFSMKTLKTYLKISSFSNVLVLMFLDILKLLSCEL